MMLLIGACVPSWATETIPAGFDLFETVPEETHVMLTLPQDFFGPSCAPFEGDVPLMGEPLGSFMGRDTGSADTIVQRHQEAMPLATIPIELVALSLMSVDPIQVQCGGNPTLWDVHVTQSANSRSLGQMTIRHESEDGGTFDSVLNVCPLYSFRQRGVNNQVQLDACDLVQPIQLLATNVPWRHQCPAPILVVPGLNDDFCASADDNGKFLTVEQSQLAQHGVLPAQPRPHFKCYEIRHRLDSPVSIRVRDQFDLEELRVRDARMLCEPATKALAPNDPPELADLLPLVCYSIRGRTLNEQVTLEDQFLVRQVRVRRPVFFCDPTEFKKIKGGPKKQQHPPRLPPYKCYEIDRHTFPISINARDQFHLEQNVPVREARLLCEPVAKAHAPDVPGEAPQDPPPVKCYTIINQPRPNVKVAVEDQFDLFAVTVGRPVFFCNPVKKTRGPGGGGVVVSEPSASAASRLDFEVLSKDHESARLQIFDLNGRLIHDGGFVRGQTLSWNLLNTRGMRVARGVYLYVITLRGWDGAVRRGELRKLIVR
jgi:hypothetical protein